MDFILLNRDYNYMSNFLEKKIFIKFFKNLVIKNKKINFGYHII